MLVLIFARVEAFADGPIVKQLPSLIVNNLDMRWKSAHEWVMRTDVVC